MIVCMRQYSTQTAASFCTNCSGDVAHPTKALRNSMTANTALNQQPEVPPTHFVDHRIYNDPDIFQVETDTIFAKSWKFVCHESEIANPLDFRTTSVAGVALIVLRNERGEIKCFVNVCSHRGVKFEQRPAGTASKFICPFHRWTYDTNGACIAVPGIGAYAACGIEKADLGLREVRTAQKYGLVFVNLDDNAMGLDEFLGDALDALAPVFENQELEVIHYNEQVLDANWKNWQETNMDLYHEYLHVVNRRTSLSQDGYHERKWHVHANGHTTIDPMKVNYAKMKGWKQRSDVVFDGLTTGEFRHACLFPDIVFLCRSTILRVDVQIPISATQTLIQFRGLGVKGESEERRLQRVRDHNEFWGPFGRNLPEDMVVSVAQGKAMSQQAGGYTLFAREQDDTTHDDLPGRAWYAEWARQTGIDPASPAQ